MNSILSLVLAVSSLLKDEPTSVFDFTVVDIEKQERKLDEFRGNVTLVVNVASF